MLKIRFKKKTTCSVRHGRHSVGAGSFGTVVSSCALLWCSVCVILYWRPWKDTVHMKPGSSRLGLYRTAWTRRSTSVKRQDKTYKLTFRILQLQSLKFYISILHGFKSKPSLSGRVTTLKSLCLKRDMTACLVFAKQHLTNWEHEDKHSLLCSNEYWSRWAETPDTAHRLVNTIPVVKHSSGTVILREAGTGRRVRIKGRVKAACSPAHMTWDWGKS